MKGPRVLHGRSNGITPLAVSAGEFVQVTVQFLPTASTPDVCTAALQINGDTWNPVSLPITATVGELRVFVTPITAFPGSYTAAAVVITSIAGDDTTATLYFTADASSDTPNVTVGLIDHPSNSFSIGKGQSAVATVVVTTPPDFPTGVYPWTLSVWAFDNYSLSVPLTIYVTPLYWCIQNKLTGNVIDIAEASTKAGAQLDAWPMKASDNDNQLWEFILDFASGCYFIKSKLSGNVIDIAGASTKAGAGLDAWPMKASGNDNQLWQLVGDGWGNYFIKSKLNGNVIDIQGASSTPGALLDVYAQNPSGNDNQLWEQVLDPAGSGYYFFKSKLNGNVIDIQGGSSAPGAPLDAWPQQSSGNDNQLWEQVGWEFPSVQAGYFFIKSKLNGNVIDIQGASSTPGALLDAYPQKSAEFDNQLWYLVPPAHSQ